MTEEARPQEAWRQRPTATLSMMVTCPQPADVVGCAELWLDEGPALLARHVDLGARSMERGLGRIGCPLGDGSWFVPDTDEARRELAESLERFHLGVGAWWLQDPEASHDGSVGSADVGLDVSEAGWLQPWLEVEVLDSAVSGVPRALADDFLHLLERFLSAFPATYAEISAWSYRSLQGATPWEDNLERDCFGDGMHTSARHLRGFGWATLLTDHYVERLGGRGALQRSKLFCELTRIQGMGTLARSTQHLHEFTRDRKRELAAFLSPVLVQRP